MNHKDFELLKFKGLELSIHVETEDTSEHSGYSPCNVLIYVKKGTMHMRDLQKAYTFPSPAYLVTRKNTLGYLRKSWTPAEGKAEVFIILLQDAFIKEALKEIEASSSSGSYPVENINPLEANEYLNDLFVELSERHTKQLPIDEAFAVNGIRRAIQGCITANPALYGLFNELATPMQIHLKKIVDHHFHLGLNVEELAAITGLSLSSFYRKFKKEFGDSPHRWLMRRKLQMAYELLQNTKKTVSMVSNEVGFKYLAHFSKRFKKQFGIAPSSLKS